MKVKISDDYFLIALANSEQDLARNLDLMQTRAWFDFPLLLNDDRIAKLVFQKSSDGEAMLEKAFDAWKSETPAAAPEQEGKSQPPLYQSSPDAQARPPAAEVEQKPSPPPAPKPPADAPSGAPPPTDEVLPQYKFAHAATESPVIGANADTRYFTIVYGMIRSHLREPPHATPPSRGGAVVFTVDETGNLVQRKLVSSCGSPNLDMAVMEAIAEAAPYPAPPDWQTRSMRLTYGK